MLSSPDNRKQSREHDIHIPKTWNGQFLDAQSACLDVVMDIIDVSHCLGKLAASYYLSLSGRKVNKEGYIKGLFLFLSSSVLSLLSSI